MDDVSLPEKTASRQWRLTALLAWLPGALAGLQLTGLLFFLNPQLPFAPSPWLRAMVVYVLVLGAMSVTILLPFTRGDLERARRALPWSIVVVFALAAFSDWYHASVFAYYLPPGINRRLIKAALLLSVATVIAFYIALLHSLQRRPYRWRSRTTLAALAVLSIYLIVERREAFRPTPEASPRPSAVETEQRPNLVVVGLEAATLDAILPMAQQGELPFLAEALERGSYGRLKSFQPTRREPLWTALATGKHPYQHGVLGKARWRADFIARGATFELLPQGIGFDRWGTLGRVRAPQDEQRRLALPIWEVLNRLEVATAVIGWPAAEPIPPGMAAGLAEADLELSDRLASESEVRAELEAQKLGRRFGLTASRTVRRAVARDYARFARARELLESSVPEEGKGPSNGSPATPDAGDLDPSARSSSAEVRALFLTLPGLGDVSRETYGGYWEVQFEGSQDQDEQEAARTLTSYYAYVDGLLAQLWDKTPEPRQLVVLSPYGVRSPEGLGRLWARLRGEGRLEASTRGAPDGIFLLRGDGIAEAALLDAPNLVDVAPTLLYSVGLPLARDFDGRLVSSAFTSSFLQRTTLTFLPSYETLTGITPRLRPSPDL